MKRKKSKQGSSGNTPELLWPTSLDSRRTNVSLSSPVSGSEPKCALPGCDLLVAWSATLGDCSINGVQGVTALSAVASLPVSAVQRMLSELVPIRDAKA